MAFKSFIHTDNLKDGLISTIKIAANAVTFGKLSTILQGKVDAVVHQIATGAVADGTASVFSFAPFAMEIDSLKVSVDSGSCSIDIEINGVGVIGMTGLAVTSSTLTATATALNSVAIDDEITMVISNNSTALGFGLTMTSSRS